jgi:hypothetical protein
MAMQAANSVRMMRRRFSGWWRVENQKNHSRPTMRPVLRREFDSSMTTTRSKAWLLPASELNASTTVTSNRSTRPRDSLPGAAIVRSWCRTGGVYRDSRGPRVRFPIFRGNHPETRCVPRLDVSESRKLWVAWIAAWLAVAHLLLAGEAAVRLLLPHEDAVRFFADGGGHAHDAEGPAASWGIPTWGWRLRPGLRMNPWLGMPVTTTRDGFRSDHEFPRPPRGRRVVCVGDSVTFGYGLISPDQVYPGVLERLLRERRANRSSTLVPMGVPAYSSLQGRLWARAGDRRPAAGSRDHSSSGSTTRRRGPRCHRLLDLAAPAGGAAPGLRKPGAHARARGDAAPARFDIRRRGTVPSTGHDRRVSRQHPLDDRPGAQHGARSWSSDRCSGMRIPSARSRTR